MTDSGGGGGIRTHGTISRTPVFKTGALNRSATPPDDCFAFLKHRKTVKHNTQSTRVQSLSERLLSSFSCRVNGHCFIYQHSEHLWADEQSGYLTI